MPGATDSEWPDTSLADVSSLRWYEAGICVLVGFRE